MKPISFETEDKLNKFKSLLNGKLPRFSEGRVPNLFILIALSPLKVPTGNLVHVIGHLLSKPTALCSNGIQIPKFAFLTGCLRSWIILMEKKNACS